MSMNAKVRTAIAAGALGVGVAGVAYGAWAVMYAILTASPMTQFLVAASCAAAGTMAAFASIKER